MNHASPEQPTPFFLDAMNALQELRAEPRLPRVTCDEHGILMAMAVALRADCTRRRVGAVVVDAHGRVIGTGRNGAAPGRPGCLSDGACPRGQQGYDQIPAGASYSVGRQFCPAIHAETNACLFSDPIGRRGGQIFITDSPCDDCSKVLAGSGLARAVWPERTPDGGWVVRSINIAAAPVGGWYEQKLA